MPIVGVLPDGRTDSVINIPAYETIQVLGTLSRRGLVEVQWGTGRVKVFSEDVIGCCEQLQEPGAGEQ